MTPGDSQSHSPPDIAGLAIAAGLMVLALVIFWDMSRLQLTSVYGVGPKAMPVVIASGLAILAVANAVIAWQGHLPLRDDYSLKAVLLILGGFVALIALIGLGGGFIPAIAVLFTATATAFGRRAPLIDFAIGLALGLVIYLAFDKLLTLSLPAGPIERLL